MYIISYFTPNYEDQWKRLLASCIKFKYPYHAYPISTLGVWEYNCALKPLIMSWALQKYEEILYIDADAEIMREIPFDYLADCDFAVHRHQKAFIMSGTIYANRNALPLIDSWLEQQNKHPAVLDQRVLEDVMKNESSVRMKQLPMEWTYVFDWKFPVTPIIVHNQHSRTIKKAMLREVLTDKPQQ